MSLCVRGSFVQILFHSVGKVKNHPKIPRREIDAHEDEKKKKVHNQTAPKSVVWRVPRPVPKLRNKRTGKARENRIGRPEI